MYSANKYLCTFVICKGKWKITYQFSDKTLNVRYKPHPLEFTARANLSETIYCTQYRILNALNMMPLTKLP